MDCMPITLSNHRKERGFTLVETLVALFILTMGLVPILVVGFSSRHVAETVKNNLVVANLAQEGIEVVRGIRDTNWVASASFAMGLNDGDYEAVWNSTTLMPDAGRFLNLSSGGLYTYSAGTPTMFQRRISVARTSPVELKVVVTVYWNERGTNKTLEIESHLFDWF